MLFCKIKKLRYFALPEHNQNSTSNCVSKDSIGNESLKSCLPKIGEQFLPNSTSCISCGTK